MSCFVPNRVAGALPQESASPSFERFLATLSQRSDARATWSFVRAPAEKVAEELASAVKSGGVDSQKSFHALDEIGAGSLDDQMKLVGHETKSDSF
jgi:hypothetical protein